MGYQFAADDLEMLQAFIEESLESLQKVEDYLVGLETANSSESRDQAFHQVHTIQSTALDDIFHQVHTIKGLSAFFSLMEITRVSQQMEYVLGAMCKGEIQSGEREIALLLVSKDGLSEMILSLRAECAGISQGGQMEVDLSCTYNIDELIHDMQLLLVEKPEADEIDLGQSLLYVDEVKIWEEVILHQDHKEEFDSQRVPFLLTGVAVGLMEDFLLEADEHSAIITDQLLIRLDSNPEDVEALGDLFRRVHTIKGNTGLLLSVPIDDGLKRVLKDVLDVLQNMESMLAQVRDGKMPISSETVNLCFEVMDGLMVITAMLRKGVVVFDDGKLKRLVAAMVGVHACGLGDIFCQAAVVEALVKSSTPKVINKNTEMGTGGNGHSIRVSGEKIDRLMNVIGELATTKNVFIQIARKLAMEHNLPHLSREIKDAGQFVNRISAELENAIMGMRMTEVRVAFQKYPRIIRDIALQTGKSILLSMEGEDTELDKNIIEQIGDPLLHLVRNAGDHGIEVGEERRTVGKDIQGNVWLRAYNRGKHVIIEVEDDGRGMDPDKLRRKAVEKEFITEAEAVQMSDAQAFQLIFLPGFSMAKSVTEISGRGVGMDVVRSNITALQGTIKIDSQLGKGSKITMQLPLTLMVSRGLVVEVGQQLLVLPLDNVLEIAKVSEKQLVKRRGKRILYHRGEVLGIVSLAEILKMPIMELADYTPVVIVTDGQSKVGMIVDRLLSEQDILVKPLPEYLSGISGMGGATIMGDGKVALVLNPVELVQMAIN